MTKGCWRQPGCDIKDFEYLQVVHAGDYDDACKTCWREGTEPVWPSKAVGDAGSDVDGELGAEEVSSSESSESLSSE